MLKKIILIAFFTVISLKAISIDSLINSFQKKDFKIVCQDGMKKFNSGNSDEDFLGMVGVACAEIDYINPLAILQKVLRKTKSGRTNASYFATLILQKKLLYQFMLDDIDLGYLRVPDTNHILSIVFKHLILGNYETLSTSPKKLEIKDGDRTIKIFTLNANPKKVIVDIYKNGKKVKRHWYR